MFLGRPWVGLVVGLPQPLLGDVSVDLGGREGGVTQEGLNTAEIGPRIEEMSCKGVAQLVGSDVEGNVGVGKVFLKQGIDRAGGKTFPELGDKEGALRYPGTLSVGSDCLYGMGADWDEALLGPLSEDPQGITEVVQVVYIKCGEFREAQSGRVKKLEDRSVTQGKPVRGLLFKRNVVREFDKLFYLPESEHDWELALEFGKLDLDHGVPRQPVAEDEELVEGP